MIFVQAAPMPPDVARRVLEIDLLGVFMAMKYQLPVMDRQFRANGAGGAIVNIASVAGIAGRRCSPSTPPPSTASSA